MALPGFATTPGHMARLPEGHSVEATLAGTAVLFPQQFPEPAPSHSRSDHLVRYAGSESGGAVSACAETSCRLWAAENWARHKGGRHPDHLGLGVLPGELLPAVRQVAFWAKNGQVVVGASNTDASAAHSSISKGPMAPVVMS
jgi:hypothetical protein